MRLDVESRRAYQRDYYRHPHWQRKRAAACRRWRRRAKDKIYRRDGWRCHYCRKRRGRKHLSFDHKVPLRKGGTNDPSNIVTCCLTCNKRKCTKPYEVFMAEMNPDFALDLSGELAVGAEWEPGANDEM